VVGVYLVVKR